MDVLPPNAAPVPFNPRVLDTQVAPAARPAPPLTRAAIFERFNWTENELQMAFAFGFPKADQTLGRNGATHVWNSRLVQEWAAKLVALAATMEGGR